MEKPKISSLLVIIAVLGLIVFILVNIWLFRQQINYENEAKGLLLPNSYNERVVCSKDKDCALFRDRCGDLTPINKKFLYAIGKQQQEQVEKIDAEFRLCPFDDLTLLPGQEFVARCQNNQCILAREKKNTGIKILIGAIIIGALIAVILIKKKRRLKLS